MTDKYSTYKTVNNVHTVINDAFRYQITHKCQGNERISLLKINICPITGDHDIIIEFSEDSDETI